MQKDGSYLLIFGFVSNPPNDNDVEAEGHQS
jgi:hypothetical protein